MMSKKEYIERVLWTFAQAFVAGWALTNFELSKGAAIAALAAGISAFKNFLKATL